MGDSITDISSKCHHFDENIHIRVFGVIDEISLMDLDGNVENLVHERNKLRAGLLQLLCLEQFYKPEAGKRINLLI